MTTNIAIRWFEKEPVIEVSNVEGCDNALDRLAAGSSPDHPTVVFVEAHGQQVSLGLGRDESFVHFEHESGDPPYLATVGDLAAEGLAAFYLFGSHHTEIRRRHLIPVARARQIVRAFVLTGSRPSDVAWEEI